MTEQEKTLPAWFYRVNKIYNETQRPVQPEEYDEDLSSLSSWPETEDEDDEDWTEEEKELAKALMAEVDDAKQEELYARLNELQIAREIENGADVDENGDDDDDDGDWQDTTSEQSYDGPDVFEYYVFKDERIDRKKELLMDPKLKAVGRAFETKFIDEVKAAKSAPLQRTLGGQGFYLYSTDDLEHYGLNLHAPSILEFEASSGSDTNVKGSIVLEPSRAHSIAEFRAPQIGSVAENITAKTTIEREDSTAERASHQISIQFISDDYVKVTAPQDFVFEDDFEMEEEDLEQGPQPGPDAPRTFEYYGIRRDLLKQRNEGEKSEEMAEEIWKKALEEIKEVLEQKKKSRQEQA
ncbi:hypothetical protein M011DRAFT_471426 [Sporormia fimetaria CBS 119925]|uniref:Uncharacterized protein n=1 Tax=Sporormia fimetaria CBS 119925 TaxID=1340428 RepID=A0A6A6V120_9PLEO|nr:hypothetical protein M011DRAFT_471426 [Sporormia fimetaria CBS 119925]